MKNSFSLTALFTGLFLGIAISIWSFSEPSDNPPSCTVSTPGCNEPINVGIMRQNKNGGEIGILNLQLGMQSNGSQAEGDIKNIDELVGYRDLILRGSPGNADPIYIEGNPVVINNDPPNAKVGIGTANPLTTLHIVSAEPHPILIESSNHEAMIEFNLPADPNSRWEIGPDGDFFKFEALPSGITPFVIKHNTGNVGIGTANPGASLEIVAPVGANPIPSQTLRLKKTAGVAGSVDLFVAIGIGSPGGQTGTAACRAVVPSNATCLEYWDSAGTRVGCGTNRANGRALCIDFGD